MKNIQDQYILRLPIDGMKRVSSEKINCRCWSCGDSKTNKRKKRGWFIWNKRFSTYVYFCHNCGLCTNFKGVAKNLSLPIYDMYMEEEKKAALEMYVCSSNDKEDVIQDESLNLEMLPEGCIPAVNSEECLTYLKNRKIPEYFIKKWFYHKSYGLVVPFEFEDDLVYGWQGRKLKTKEFHTNLPEENPKIWNLFSVNKSEKVFVLESIIDATMLYLIGYQAISIAGADVSAEDLSDFEDLVFIFDNDETGKSRCIKYSNIFKKSEFLVWDKRIRFKDLNEIICSGVDLQKFKKFIDSSIKTSYEIAILSKMKLL